MDRLSSLKKLLEMPGAKLLEDLGENKLIRLPDSMGGKTVSIPRNTLGEGAFGKTIVKDTENKALGQVLNPRSDGDLAKILENKDPMGDKLKQFAAKNTSSLIGNQTPDILSGTIGALKNLGNKYEEDVRAPIKEGVAGLLGAEDSSTGAIGKKILSPFDITKDKSGFPEIEETVGDYVTDPMSLTDLIPGKAQTGAAIKSGREILPKLAKLLKR